MLHPLPVVRAARRDRVPLRRPGPRRLPGGPGARCPTRSGREYLFFRDNPKGPFAERWSHTAGCRRWFNAVRDTATHELLAVYRPDERQAGDPMSASRLPERWPDRPDHARCLHLRRQRCTGLPGRHPGLGPARQRRPPGRHQRQVSAARAASWRPASRSPNALRPDRGAVPEPMLPATTVELYDGLVGPWPRRPGPAGPRAGPGPLRRRARALRRAGRRRRPGRSGRRAAAARAGARVVLLDERPELGGALLGR